MHLARVQCAATINIGLNNNISVELQAVDSNRKNETVTMIFVSIIYTQQSSIKSGTK
jgi:hypothetical protein